MQAQATKAAPGAARAPGLRTASFGFGISRNTFEWQPVFSDRCNRGTTLMQPEQACSHANAPLWQRKSRGKARSSAESSSACGSRYDTVATSVCVQRRSGDDWSKDGCKSFTKVAEASGGGSMTSNFPASSICASGRDERTGPRFHALRSGVTIGFVLVPSCMSRFASTVSTTRLPLPDLYPRTRGSSNRIRCQTHPGRRP